MLYTPLVFLEFKGSSEGRKVGVLTILLGIKARELLLYFNYNLLRLYGSTSA